MRFALEAQPRSTFGKWRASCSQRSFFSYILFLVLLCKWVIRIRYWIQVWSDLWVKWMWGRSLLSPSERRRKIGNAMVQKKKWKAKWSKESKNVPSCPLRRVKISCLAGNEQAFHICMIRTLGGHMATQGKYLQNYAGFTLLEDIIMRYTDLLRKKRA